MKDIHGKVVICKAAFGPEALCARILKRHRASIAIQKEPLAIAKLSRIILAALALANRTGFHAMSLRELSRKSGVSMGGLYSYFDSKNTLLAMVLTEVSVVVQEVLAQAPEEVVADPRRHLRWLIDTHIRLTEIMQPWFAFAYMEAKAFPSSARRMAIDSEQATEAIFHRVIEAGARDGVFRVADAGLTAALIKPLLQDWYVKRSKYRRRSVEMDSYIAAVQSMVEGACGVESSTAEQVGQRERA